MSKPIAKHVLKAKNRGYVYNTPKAVKTHGGGHVRILTLGDKYRKEEESQVASSSYRYGGVPAFGAAGLWVRLHQALLAGPRERIAEVVDIVDSNAPIVQELWQSVEIDEPTIAEFRSSAETLRHFPIAFLTDKSKARMNQVLDEATSKHVGFYTVLSSFGTFPERFAQQEWALVGFSNSLEERPNTNWVHEPEGILQRLERKEAYPEDYEAAVLFAEVKPFHGEQRTRLLEALGKYINENRFVEDQDSLVTLCSAIRKYAMNMPESNFEGYATWLLPTETATLHHEAEMEFAKGICWRLEFEPHVWPADYPILTKTLFDLVDSYLTPRLILQKSYANTAMFGMVALHVLEAIATSRNVFVGSLRKKMMDSGVKWFTEMVYDQVDEAIEYISQRDEALAKEVIKIRQG
jgi:hypothetical protein